MQIKAEESSGFEKPHISEGLHHAQLMRISDAPDGKFGARVALDFIVYYNRMKNPVKIGRVFGKKLTPKAQLWEAFESLGANLQVGTYFDTKTLTGKKCRVMVEDYKDNDGKIVSGITKVKKSVPETIDFIEEVKKNLSEPQRKNHHPEAVVTERVGNDKLSAQSIETTL